MKTFKLIICFLFLSLFTACLDTEENITVNEDNSGVYAVSFDLGKMLQMIRQMGEGKSSEAKTPEKKDSTVYLRDLVMSSDSLTSEEKELYKDGSIHIKMDEENNEMKLVFTCPFKNISRLPEIKENFLKILDKLKAFDKVTDKQQKSEMTEEEGGDIASKIMSPGSGNNYTFTAEPGKIANTITNAEDYKKEILSDSVLVGMQQLTSMMGEMTFKTTITTPREIKNYSGNNAALSDSKKTVIFKNTFTDMFEHPEKMAYKVEY